MKRFNVEISDEEQQFCADFRENVEMVLSYKKDCIELAKHIGKEGLPNNFVRKTLDGNLYESKDLVSALLDKLVSMEEYELCSGIANASGHGKDLPEELSKRADSVMSFDENCEVCYMVLYRHETSPWYGFKEPPTDSRKLLVVLLNYFHDNGMHDRCIELKPVLEEIEEEIRDGNPLFDRGVRMDPDEYILKFK